MTVLSKLRSEISKRAWRIRKRLGGKGKCVYCHRSIFAGGMTFKGRAYHKTCLSFLKMGLTPKQAGLENPQSIADWWNSRRLSFQNELLYFLGYEHDWEREWNLLKPDVKAVITKWYKIYESKQVANPQSLECPSCHNPIENPKRLRIGWCPNCGAKVGVRNPHTAKNETVGQYLKRMGIKIPNNATAKEVYELYSAIREKEGNPRPPSAWWTAMMPRVRAQYPKFGKERLSQVLGGVWWKLPEATRKRIIKEYD